MMPLSAPFRGYEFNPSKFFPPKTPPLFYAMTSGGTAYRFHPFVEDVGHQLIVGPTGGGKTTWLALGIAQWFRYPDGQVFAFDKKRTLYTLCKAMGGDFYDLNPDSREYQLCPLQDLETNSDIQWAAQWIELLLKQNNLDITPAVRNSVKDGLRLLAGSHGGRSLNDFRSAVGSREVQDALVFYIDSILDGDRDNIRLSRFSVFEMDELYRMDPKLMNGALFYIFGRIRKRLNSEVPTLVTVDEFREALSHELAAKYFNDFLFEGRKLNMSVWLIVQEMSRVLDSPLRGAVLEQCHTKVLLPNSLATADGASSYALMGLNNRDRELIANATPKSDYYVAAVDGNKRMISLELQELTLAFIAASGEPDRALVDKLSAEYGNHWPGEWLRRRGLIEWADKFHEVAGTRQIAAAAR
jgi:type IV secretion system protein VirB4